MPDLPPHAVLSEHFQERMKGRRLVTAVFLTIDLSFFGANLAKIADGGWFAIFVLFSQERLGLGPSGFGALLAVGAAGGLVRDPPVQPPAAARGEELHRLEAVRGWAVARRGAGDQLCQWRADFGLSRRALG